MKDPKSYLPEPNKRRMGKHGARALIISRIEFEILLAFCTDARTHGLGTYTCRSPRDRGSPESRVQYYALASHGHGTLFAVTSTVVVHVASCRPVPVGSGGHTLLP